MLSIHKFINFVFAAAFNITLLLFFELSSPQQCADEVAAPSTSRLQQLSGFIGVCLLRNAGWTSTPY